MIGNELNYEYADGRTERRVVLVDELDSALRELDVVLTAEELDRLQTLLG